MTHCCESKGSNDMPKWKQPCNFINLQKI